MFIQHDLKELNIINMKYDIILATIIFFFINNRIFLIIFSRFYSIQWNIKKKIAS